MGLLRLLERVGNLAYRLALPPSLERLHDVFHVSMLRKYVYDPSHVLPSIPEDVEPDMSYVEQPIQVIDTKVQELRTKSIPLVRVVWRNHNVEESTWELREEMERKYPWLFDLPSKSSLKFGSNFLLGGVNVTTRKIGIN